MLFHSVVCALGACSGFAQCVHQAQPGKHCSRNTWLLIGAGTAHVVAIVLCCLRINFLVRDRQYMKYRLQRGARAVHATAVTAGLVVLLVVLFQLNARAAKDPGPLIHGDVAPFEWAGIEAPA